MGIFLIIIALAALYLVFKKISSEEQTDADIGIKSFTPKLPIEFIPKSMHYCNVRSRLTATQWQYICTKTHDTPKYMHKSCTICGGNGKAQGFKHSLECHEKWEYDTASQTQSLVGLLSICPMCHKVFHYGLAKKEGFGDQAFKHMKKINGWTEEQALQYIAESEAIVRRRSKINWKLDLTYLNKPKYSFLHTTFTTDEKSNCDKAKGQH